jgi:uncharacterized protein
MTGFTWHELMATDVPRAQAFYSALFGWDCSDGAIRVGQRTIGAIMPFAGAPGFGTHWVPYVAVGDLDGLCREVGACGGTVCFGPVAHPGGGRFAFVTDPQRGFFSAREAGPVIPHTSEPGGFWLDKLLADDVDTAQAFYARLLGWRTFDEGGAAWMIRRPPVAPMTMWLPHVVVDDVSEVARRAAQLGGHVPVAPKRVDGVGTFTVVADASAGIVAAIAPEVRHVA